MACLVAADLDIAYGKYCLARLGWGAKDFRERVQHEEEAGGDGEVRSASVEQDTPAAAEEVLDTMFEECGCAPVRHLEPVRTFEDARVVFKAANPR